MNASKIRISLDMHSTCSSVLVSMKRGDTGRRLYITLTEDGKPYLITKECYAVFTATKPDGAIVFNECTIKDGVIIYDVTAQTTAVVGELPCEVKLYGADDMLLTSASFSLVVEDTVYNEGDEVESSDEFSALTALMSQAIEVINTVAPEKANAIALYAEGEQIDVDDSSDNKLLGLRILGKTVQDGTPTPESPVDLESVGGSGTYDGWIIDGVEREQLFSFITPNGLPGIPVTSGGNYVDGNGQMWVCDEIDFARGVYKQNCKKITFTGDENWRHYSNGTNQYTTFTNTSCFSLEKVENKAIGYETSLCSHFKNTNNATAFNATGAKHGMYSDHANLRNFYFAWGEVGQTVDEWKAWVKAQYDAGMPVEVVYVLEEPVETALSDEEMEAYKALHTYKPHTTIASVDGTKVKPYLMVDYSADTKTYIDNKIGGVY